MRKNNGNSFIVGMDFEDHEYTVNGVRYIVSAQYAPTVVGGEGERTFSELLHNYVRSDLADLTAESGTDMLENEYACSAAISDAPNL